MIELLIFILTTFAGGILSGLVTHFLWWTFGSPDDEVVNKGRIFSFYGFWLQRKYNAFHVKHPDGINIYKPLGLCPYCFGTWVAFGIGIGLSFMFGLGWHGVVFVALQPGVSLITLKIINP